MTEWINYRCTKLRRLPDGNELLCSKASELELPTEAFPKEDSSTGRPTWWDTKPKRKDRTPAKRKERMRYCICEKRISCRPLWFGKHPAKYFVFASRQKSVHAVRAGVRALNSFAPNSSASLGRCESELVSLQGLFVLRWQVVKGLEGHDVRACSAIRIRSVDHQSQHDHGSRPAPGGRPKPSHAQ